MKDDLEGRVLVKELFRPDFFFKTTDLPVLLIL